MALFTVDGNKEPGFQQTVDDLQFLLAGVAGHMDFGELVADHIGALTVQFIDDVADGLFVAGDGGRRQNDPVAGLNLHLPVGRVGHAIQGRHILALGAGGHNDQLFLGDGFDLVDVHHGFGGQLHIAQLRGHLEDVLHTAAGKGNFSAILVGHGDQGLEPVGVGGKSGDDDSLIAVFEQPVKALGDHHFVGGVAAPFHVGGIAQQSQNTLLAQLAEPAQINHTILGGGVDLEVAGHNHGADGRLDGKGHGVGNGVVDVDELHLKVAGLDGLPGLMGDELALVQNLVLLQFQLHQAQRQAGTVDGGFDLLEHIGQGADVVLVAVGQENAADLVLVLDEVRHIGDHQIHAVHVALGKAHAAVHNDDVAAIFQHGHILADLIETAQAHNFQFFSQ